MSKNDRTINDLDFVTEKISDLSRYVGFSLTGAVIFALNSESSFFQELVKNNKIELITCSLGGVLVIIFDYLHYLSAYFASFAKYKSNSGGRCKFCIKIFQPMRYLFFLAKQVIAILASTLFAWILLSALV